MRRVKLSGFDRPQTYKNLFLVGTAHHSLIISTTEQPTYQSAAPTATAANAAPIIASAPAPDVVALAATPSETRPASADRQTPAAGLHGAPLQSASVAHATAVLPDAVASTSLTTAYAVSERNREARTTRERGRNSFMAQSTRLDNERDRVGVMSVMCVMCVMCVMFGDRNVLRRNEISDETRQLRRMEQSRRPVNPGRRASIARPRSTRRPPSAFASMSN